MKTFDKLSIKWKYIYELKLKIMKRLAVILLLFAVVISVSAQTTKTEKDSSKTKTLLVKKVSIKLDSLARTKYFEKEADGSRYYKIVGGVIVFPTNYFEVGGFGVLGEIHFAFKHGEILVVCEDKFLEPKEITLEELMFALEKY